ncbi:prevent-host-death protein [Lacticaseibacillus mingshuiensis]|uniref:prevent-host-death protein n=1 Tax=Lacticaseibacillus mingshuiensis TaxID=2799574 RepID=UPI00194F5979|nr:prevent-host-death protein [Lacticaseibacillus mingshuiensis]
METDTPTNLRKKLFDVLSQVANSDKGVEITLKQPSGPNKGVVMLSKARHEKLEELDLMVRMGTLETVLNRMAHEKPDDFSESTAY